MFVYDDIIEFSAVGVEQMGARRGSKTYIAHLVYLPVCVELPHQHPLTHSIVPILTKYTTFISAYIRLFEETSNKFGSNGKT